MKISSLISRVLMLATIASLATTAKAHAYIDPGSGSFFVQALLASLLAAGMGIKAYWHKIKGFFSRGDTDSKPLDDESPDS